MNFLHKVFEDVDYDDILQKNAFACFTRNDMNTLKEKDVRIENAKQ